MCLLTTSTASAFRTTFLATPGLLENVYKNNPDGIGIMFAQRGKVKVFKALPKTAAEAHAFLESKLPKNDTHVAIHWRWRTHGAINIDQCHPYKVSETAWLMHNGMLHTGNEDDDTKSDTWHFAKNYLAGLPDDTLHHAGFLNLIGDYIENNRFALLSADGRLSVVNTDQGIEHGGVWFSNTYAWEPSLLIPEYGFRKNYRWPDTFELTPDEAEFDYEQADEDLEWFVNGCDPDGLATMFTTHPDEVAVMLRELWQIEKHEYTDMNDLTTKRQQMLATWLNGTAKDIAAMVQDDPQAAAEVLIFNCDLTNTQPTYDLE